MANVLYNYDIINSSVRQLELMPFVCNNFAASKTEFQYSVWISEKFSSIEILREINF